MSDGKRRSVWLIAVGTGFFVTAFALIFMRAWTADADDLGGGPEAHITTEVVVQENCDGGGGGGAICIEADPDDECEHENITEDWDLITPCSISLGPIPDQKPIAIGSSPPSLTCPRSGSAGKSSLTATCDDCEAILIDDQVYNHYPKYNWSVSGCGINSSGHGRAPIATPSGVTDSNGWLSYMFNASCTKCPLASAASTNIMVVEVTDINADKGTEIPGMGDDDLKYWLAPFNNTIHTSFATATATPSPAVEEKLLPDWTFTGGEPIGLGKLKRKIDDRQATSCDFVASCGSSEKALTLYIVEVDIDMGAKEDKIGENPPHETDPGTFVAFDPDNHPLLTPGLSWDTGGYDEGQLTFSPGGFTAWSDAEKTTPATTFSWSAGGDAPTYYLEATEPGAYSPSLTYEDDATGVTVSDTAKVIAQAITQLRCDDVVSETDAPGHNETVYFSGDRTFSFHATVTPSSPLPEGEPTWSGWDGASDYAGMLDAEFLFEWQYGASSSGSSSSAGDGPVATVSKSGDGLNVFNIASQLYTTLVAVILKQVNVESLTAEVDGLTPVTSTGDDTKTMSVAVNSVVNLTAKSTEPNPINPEGPTIWPPNEDPAKPAWVLESAPLGANSLDISNGAPTGTYTPNKVGTYNIKCSCGNDVNIKLIVTPHLDLVYQALPEEYDDPNHNETNPGGFLAIDDDPEAKDDVEELKIDVTSSVKTGTLTLTVSDSSLVNAWEKKNKKKPIDISSGKLEWDLGQNEKPPQSIWVEALEAGVVEFTLSWVDGTISATSDSVKITLPKVTLKQIAFSGNGFFLVRKDDESGNYDPPHWLDANLDGDADDSVDKKYPVCYTKGSTPIIEGKYAVNPSLPADLPLMIKGNGPGNVEVSATDATFSNNEISFTATAGKMPSQVQRMESCSITWYVSFDGGNNWSDVGISANEIFLVEGTPGCRKNYRTVLYLGCDGGGTVASVWAKFSGRNVCSWDEQSQSYSEKLFYYKTYEASAGLTSSLLETHNGNCFAFRDILSESLAVNNHEHIEAVLKPNDPPAIAFYVNNVNFNDPSFPQYSPWKYVKNNIDISPEQIPGQWTSPPKRKDFGVHAIIKIGSIFYDPSYGISTNAIESFNDIIAAWGKWDPNEIFLIWAKKIDVGGSLEIIP